MTLEQAISQLQEHYMTRIKESRVGDTAIREGQFFKWQALRDLKIEIEAILKTERDGLAQK